MRLCYAILLSVLLLATLDGTGAFVPLTLQSWSSTQKGLHPLHPQAEPSLFNQHLTTLAARKKRKRKRKAPPQTTDTVEAAPAPAATETVAAEKAPLSSTAATKPTASKDAEVAAANAALAAESQSLLPISDNEKDASVPVPDTEAAAAPISDKEKDLIGEIAKFEFTAPQQPDDAMPMDLSSSSSSSSTSSAKDQSSIPLPSIQDALQQKQLEQELAQMEQEQEAKRTKIKRSDKDAFTRLLEQNPFADADDSFFVEEEYGTVSALLGEKAKPFLGLPFGALQVGHFIAALVFVLMAFVEYPGFPLTNLPTPIRQALQGGLGTVYSINALLAVYAVFKASERGQPVPLWVVKTFSVGGLALDQLTQLPTLEQIKEAESRKGARALKKNKR